MKIKTDYKYPTEIPYALAMRAIKENERLQSIKAKVLIIGNKGDMLFNREELIFAKNAISDARYVEINTPWGHMSCVGWDPEGTEIMQREISSFLSSLSAN